MSVTDYTYSIADDTANGKFAPDVFVTEYISSSIATNLSGSPSSLGDVITVTTQDVLSTADETVLNGLLAAHQGNPISDDPSSVNIVEIPAFAAKTVGDKSLFTRETGKDFALSVGANTCEFAITYPQVKLDGVEIAGCELGDVVDLKILDDASGTYSGIANKLLNQFGFGVLLPKDFYRKISKYDADLYLGMRVVFEYNSVSAKTVCINYDIHEVK